ncbi:MAG: hypothetical protein VX836_10200 [Pseudomonadota bacterium]|nr:hypothetical protein [Pseudomonadota bacterium]
MNNLVETLIFQAEEIAKSGIPGWGNTMRCAADELRRLRAFHNEHCGDDEIMWCDCAVPSAGLQECVRCGGAVEGIVLLVPNAPHKPRSEAESA